MISTAQRAPIARDVLCVWRLLLPGHPGFLDRHVVRVRRQRFVAHDPVEELRPRVRGQSSHATELVPVVTR